MKVQNNVVRASVGGLLHALLKIVGLAFAGATLVILYTNYR